MIWNITKTVFVLWGYKPVVKQAIKWIKCADGNYKATDRGINEDVFESNIIFRAPESEMIDLCSVLDEQRTQFTISCSKGEEIFGADINHSIPLTVVVTRYGKMKRVSFAEYSVPLTLRIIDPNFIGTPSIDDLRIANWNYQADASYDMVKIFSYENKAKYLTANADSGMFVANYKQTFEEMKSIRRYLLTTGRTGIVQIPTRCGIPYPFGHRVGTAPHYARIIKWADNGRQDYNTVNLKITFAQELGYPAPG